MLWWRVQMLRVLGSSTVIRPEVARFALARHALPVRLSTGHGGAGAGAPMGHVVRGFSSAGGFLSRRPSNGFSNKARGIAACIASFSVIGGVMSFSSRSDASAQLQGADCAEPVCDDTKEAFFFSLGMRPKKAAGEEKYDGKSQQSSSKGNNTSNSTITDANINNNLDSTPAVENELEECPLGRSNLGRVTWALLHTTAAYYPESNPTQVEQHAAKQLLLSLGELYPCTHCRAHLAYELATNPPRVEDRSSFSKYVCELHNKVNKVLSKAEFDCRDLDRRWRSGCRDVVLAGDESIVESLGQEEDEE